MNMTKQIPITGTGTYRILSHKTEMVKFPLIERKKNRKRIEKTREKVRNKKNEPIEKKRKQK